LDVQALCVIPGKMVWKIVIDINIVNNDGNVFDACVMGAMASYCSFK
jgi:exosome complex RNA-binding protein Rrp42 (RNase PH superfamily)